MTIGISKERLIEIKQSIPHGQARLNLERLIKAECKELDPWLTIDEFKDSRFAGLCWILNKDGDVFAYNFDGEYFINPYMPNYPIHEDSVHRVIPIKTPEAPK